MFNQSDSKVIVRLPQGGDAALTPASSGEKKKLITEAPAVQQAQVPEQKLVSAQPAPPEAEQEVAPAKNPEREETDQEKMVLELFDGKYIE